MGSSWVVDVHMGIDQPGHDHQITEVAIGQSRRIDGHDDPVFERDPCWSHFGIEDDPVGLNRVHAATLTTLIGPSRNSTTRISVSLEP